MAVVVLNAAGKKREEDLQGTGAPGRSPWASLDFLREGGKQCGGRRGVRKERILLVGQLSIPVFICPFLLLAPRKRQPGGKV